MAVRFLPPPDEGDRQQPEDRGDLAEVISLRSRLPQREWADPVTEWTRDAGVGPGGADPSDEGLRSTDPGDADSEGAGPDNAVPGDAGSGGAASGGGVPAGEETGPAAANAAIPRIGEAEGWGHPAHVAGSHPAGSSRPADPADAFADGSDGPEGTGPSRSAYEDAVRVLGRRARSGGELRDDLVRLGHDAPEVEAVIEEFVRGCYLDDLGLARILTEKLRDTKRASRAQIRRKLRERKLPDDVIETVVGELDDDEEFELLRTAARDRARRLQGLDRQTAERRLLGFLARRGWGGEPAMRAAREALDASESGRGGGVRFR